MLLRIVEKENGEILVLYNDGRYGKASISTLREIFEGIETIEDMVGETDGWELDYTEMEDYPGKTRAYRSLRGYGHLKKVPSRIMRKFICRLRLNEVSRQ